MGAQLDIEKHYEVKEKLGTGTFAEVRRGVSKDTGKEVAIKIIKKSKLNPEELSVVHDEVEIMRKIKHDNCVQLYEMFETKTTLYMVIELLTGGELFDRIVSKGSFSEKEAAAVVQSMASAIDYLHGIGIVHRDLKPENLLYLNKTDESPIKITDFGLAKLRSKEGPEMHTACGTPGYVAPEVLKGDNYSKAVDMWSLGVILYILLCGFPPFYHQNTTVLYKLIKKGEFGFPDPYWTDISSSAKELIKGLLTVDPIKRLSAAQVLQHPWVKGKEAKTDKLQGMTVQLSMLQARRKLKKVVRTIMAVNKFKAAMDFLAQVGEGSDSGSTSSTTSSTSSSTSSSSGGKKKKDGDCLVS